MTIDEEEMLLELYKELYDKLVRMVSVRDITETDLQRYFVPDAVKFSQSYFFRLASSLQNSWSMDDMTSSQRRRNMQHIRSVDTKAEVMLP